MQAMRTCYGVDLSSTRLVVVRASPARRGVETSTVVDQDLPGPGAAPLPPLARIEAEAAEGRALVSGCLPAHEGFTRWLHTPLTSLAKARKVLPSLLDIQLPFPLETCVFDFPRFRRAGLPARAGGAAAEKGPRAVDALAVAARVQDVNARLQRFRQAGLDPARLDHEGLALWAQALTELPAERDAVRVIACLGLDHTTLVLGAGEEYLGAHSLRLPAGSMAGLPAPSAGEPDAVRAFVTRAEQVLRAQFPAGGDQEVQWVWTGPGAGNAGTVGALEARLSESRPARFVTAKDPATFLARALARRGVQADALPCQFRTGALAHPLEAGQKARRERRTAMTFLAAGLLLCAANGAWRLALAHRRTSIQAELSALARGFTGMSKVPRGQEVLLSRRAAAGRASLSSPFLQAFRPAAMPLLAELLEVARRNGLFLETLSLKAGAVSIRGTADDWNRCEGVAAALREKGWLADIQRQDAGADERVHFAVKASQAEGGPSP